MRGNRMARAVIVVMAIVALYSGVADAALIGHWIFEGVSPQADLTGNFPDLLLQGNASINNGQLDVNGTGTNATGWAVTDSGSGAYAGPPITNKTLVSWLTLEGLEAVADEGSAMTLDRVGSDHFDGIIFAEIQSDRWMNGSTTWSRTQNFAPGFQETTTGALIQMAITYADLGGGNLQVTGYRNGLQIGQYTTPNASSWATGDAEVFFGVRHGNISAGSGALDARIEEARLYDEVLTAAQLNALAIVKPSHASHASHASAPAMDNLGMVIFILLAGLASVLYLKRGKTKV